MVKIFADGADFKSIVELNNNPLVGGFTTNPSLAKKAGVKDYKSFAKDVLSVVKDKPVSFEVLADDLDVMFSQAMKLAEMGDNVYVKIPITYVNGVYTDDVIKRIVEYCSMSYTININITAIMAIEQVKHVYSILSGSNVNSFISIFAGRIADTGVDPSSIIKQAKKLVKSPLISLIWASTREVYNIYQSDEVGCDIITCSPEIIKKYEMLKGKDLTEYSRETVAMFHHDAVTSGLKI